MNFAFSINFCNALLQQISQTSLQIHELYTWGINRPHPSSFFGDFKLPVFFSGIFFVQDVRECLGLKPKKYC